MLVFAAVAAGVALAARCAKRRFMLVEVSGSSMWPGLAGGDFVVVDRRAYADALPRPRDVVLASHPREPGRMIVKRVGAVDLHQGIWLAGDNVEASTDSRTFGAVPRETILGRVRWRYWPWRASGLVR